MGGSEVLGGGVYVLVLNQRTYDQLHIGFGGHVWIALDCARLRRTSRPSNSGRRRETPLSLGSPATLLLIPVVHHNVVVQNSVV